jgi:anthranilate/para-aminobenzoate synthase component I
MDQAIAIRTLVFHGGTLPRTSRAPASSPTACPLSEHAEVKAKAAALLAALRLAAEIP